MRSMSVVVLAVLLLVSCQAAPSGIKDEKVNVKIPDVTDITAVKPAATVLALKTAVTSGDVKEPSGNTKATTGDVKESSGVVEVTHDHAKDTSGSVKESTGDVKVAAQSTSGGVKESSGDVKVTAQSTSGGVKESLGGKVSSGDAKEVTVVVTKTASGHTEKSSDVKKFIRDAKSITVDLKEDEKTSSSLVQDSKSETKDTTKIMDITKGVDKKESDAIVSKSVTSDVEPTVENREIKEKVAEVPEVVVQTSDVKGTSVKTEDESKRGDVTLIKSKLKDLAEAVAESVTNIPLKPDTPDAVKKYSEIIKKFVSELMTIPMVLLNAISNAISRFTGSNVNPASLIPVPGPHPH